MKKLKFTKHAEQQLKDRFHMSADLINDCLEIFTEATKNTNKVVDNKLRNYPHQRALINKRLNLLLMTDQDLVVTALYLDGRDGYQHLYKKVG